MNFWFNLNCTEEPMNNINYINNKELQVSQEELDLIKNVLQLLTQNFSADSVTR